jgi:hypothetical protein
MKPTHHLKARILPSFEFDLQSPNFKVAQFDLTTTATFNDPKDLLAVVKQQSPP